MGAPMDEAGAYTVEMDADRARDLAQRGGTLLCLDLPQGSTFGVDQQMFTTGPRFQGVKMLPPGPHFFYYSAAGKHSGDAGPLRGFFAHLSPGQVEVRVWSPGEEAMLPPADPDEAGRYAAAATRFEFDAGLAPYDLRGLPAWRALSGHLTPALLDRLRPLTPGGELCGLEEMDAVLDKPATAAERRLADQLARRGQATEVGPDSAAAAEADAEVAVDARARPAWPAGPSPALAASAAVSSAASAARRGAFYARLPRLLARPGASPAEITALNMDKSPALAAALASHYGGDAGLMLGELQFAFIAFVMGQSLAGLEQWKALLTLLLGCEAAPLRTHRPLYLRLLPLLEAQLRQALAGPDAQARDAGAGVGPGAAAAAGGPLEGVGAALAGGGFLRRTLGDFLQSLMSAPGAGELRPAAERLAGMLRSELGWGGPSLLSELGGEGGYEDEEGEDAPVFVPAEGQAA